MVSLSSLQTTSLHCWNWNNLTETKVTAYLQWQPIHIPLVMLGGWLHILKLFTTSPSLPLILYPSITPPTKTRSFAQGQIPLTRLEGFAPQSRGEEYIGWEKYALAHLIHHENTSIYYSKYEKKMKKTSIGGFEKINIKTNFSQLFLSSLQYKVVLMS